MQSHIEALGTNGAMMEGEPANMVLDLREQPGGAAAATQPFIDYGKQFGVTASIKEYL